MALDFEALRCTGAHTIFLSMVLYNLEAKVYSGGTWRISTICVCISEIPYVAPLAETISNHVGYTNVPSFFTLTFLEFMSLLADFSLFIWYF